jgi:FAD/FMN-containing dehydrogenase
MGAHAGGTILGNPDLEATVAHDPDSHDDPPETRHDRRTFLVGLGAGAAVAAGGLPALSMASAKRSSQSSRLLRELAAKTKGRLLTRSSSGFRAAARVYNLRYSGVRPLAVLQAANESDVAAAVRWAAQNEIPITAKSGGHSYAGYSTIANGLVVDLSRLTQASINTRGRSARIGAGTQLIDMYAALARRGLTVPGGSCPSVGISGLTLGGGVGMAARRWGTTSDNLISARIVTADGIVRTVDRSRHEDLYWACRGGGGGNFGIVTSFRFRAHPARRASYFFFDFDWSDAEAVVTRWQRWAPNAPDTLYSICALETGAGSPVVRAFGQYFGSEAGLRNQLRGLTSAAEPTSLQVGSDSYINLMLLWAGCADISLARCHTQGTSRNGTLPRESFFAKSAYVSKPMSNAGARAMVRQIEIRQGQSTGSGAMLMDAYGGALNRPSPTATAFVHRDNVCSIQSAAYWGGSAGERQSIAWMQSQYRAVAPYTSGRAYQNYIDPTLTSWRRAYYGRNYDRLVDVKKRYDPDEVFRFKQGIPA